MSKIVNFVRGLRVERVVYRPWADYVDLHEMPLTTSDDGVLLGSTLQRQRAPIHRLCEFINGARRDVYIAYSKEVQDYLLTPFDALEDRALRAEAEVSEIRTRIGCASFWSRLIYLFTRKLRRH